jgi:hypothetical protein
VPPWLRDSTETKLEVSSRPEFVGSIATYIVQHTALPEGLRVSLLKLAI